MQDAINETDMTNTTSAECDGKYSILKRCLVFKVWTRSSIFGLELGLFRVNLVVTLYESWISFTLTPSVLSSSPVLSHWKVVVILSVPL